MASTKLGRDTTPTLEPEIPEKPIVVDTMENDGEIEIIDKIEDSEEVQEMPGYLNEAANVIRKAIECESEERFDESIACYRYFLKVQTFLTSCTFQTYWTFQTAKTSGTFPTFRTLLTS